MLNSRLFRALLELLMPRGATGEQTLKYNLGYVRTIPLPPSADHNQKNAVVKMVRNCIQAIRQLDACEECSHLFLQPGLVAPLNNAGMKSNHDDWLREQQQCRAIAVELSEQLERTAESLYGLGRGDLNSLYATTVASSLSSNLDMHFLLDPTDIKVWAERFFMWIIGVVFGRWDARYVIGGLPPPAHPDPFALLPICPPGMLTAQDGLPAKEAPSDYPLRIEWDGIVVDDADHASDIVRRVREVLELIWKDRADVIEKEACDILCVKELRDYFRKPGSGGFWDDHVSRYSKSRRKAPIYWLLQSGKKNYALWLYYHRLDKDILFKALVNYVEPKIRLEDDRLKTLRTQRAGASGKAAKQLDRQIEKQDAFLAELRDFEEKLRRAANLHLDPDLNDGVVLNISPLWELVPWKEAKAYWQELLAGEYEWSTIGKQLRGKGLVK
jgi:hypothetical protein